MPASYKAMHGDTVDYRTLDTSELDRIREIDRTERIEAGATAVGAFADDRLVGMGVVLPRIRPSTAQLVALYVSDGHRSRGIGGRLSDELERIARAAGDLEIVDSATPSANTVHFYLGRGFEPMAEPLPELYELEPEDVHMRKRL